MLKDYCGPGSGDKYDEITHRFIGELFYDCEVDIIPPPIDGDKSYYKITKKMASGESRTVMLQGWDLDSVAEDSIVEKRDCATSIMEKLVEHMGDVIVLEEDVETFSLIKDVSDRLCSARAEINYTVSERYHKMMLERVEKQVEKEKKECQG